MAKVTGIGGVFFKAQDPSALLSWYEQHLGVSRSFPNGVKFKWHPVAPAPDAAASPAGPAAADGASPVGSTAWALFDRDTKYFGPSSADYMINYRVDDLDALLAQLRSAGVPVEDHREESMFGRFAWITDPAGHRIELWEPPPGK